MTTVGTSLDQSYEFNNNTLIPYLNLDYTADISPSSSQKFTHISSGENFVLENINNTTHNFHGGIGRPAQKCAVLRAVLRRLVGHEGEH